MLNRLLDRLRPSASDDRGYTLPELLISVVLTGVIVATLATAMITMLRSVDSTSNRQDRAHSTRISANYFAADAAAARASDISTQPGITCGPSDAVGVASFTWNDFDNGAGTSTRKTANWVVKDDELLRRLCVGTTLKSTLTMSRDLAPDTHPLATMSTDAASGSTKVSLAVAQPPVDASVSDDEIEFTLQGTTRPAGTAPNALTPPNLLLLEETGTALDLGISSLDIVRTQGGSNEPSSGYINSSSNSAVRVNWFSSVSGTLYSPGRCSAFIGDCPDMVKTTSTVEDPLANLKSPAANTEWLAQFDLKTFDSVQSGCNLTLNGNRACPDLGPGIYKQPLWLKDSAVLGAGKCVEQTCPYILEKGMKIGQDNVRPQITSKPGVLIDLEGGTISANGSWLSGASLAFDAATAGPYAGISIFQPKSNTTDLNLVWNGSLRTDGLVYAPGASVVTGANYTGASAILNSLIANDMRLTVSFTVQIGGLDRPGPKITQLTPAYGGQGAVNRQVVLTGSNFQSGATVAFGDGPATSGISLAGSPAVSDGGTKLTFGVDIGAGAPVGATQVTVTNPDGTAISKANAYTVLPAPTVTSVSPVSRGQGATNQTVTIDGTGFLTGVAYPPGTTLAFSNPGVTVDSLVVTSGTRLTAKISIDAEATPGPVDVIVSNLAASGSPDVVVPGGFNVSKKPTVTAVTPSSGGQGQVGYPVTVTGEDFQSTAKVSFPPASGLTVKRTTWVSSTQLDLLLDIAYTAPTAASTISVDNGDGTAPGTMADAFTVLAAPKLETVSPMAGPTGGGTTVTITGTGFGDATEVLFGTTSATPTVDPTGTIITVISPAGSGIVDVKVVTPVSTSNVVPVAGTFTFGAPTISGLSVNGGAVAGGNTITVTGTNFTPDTTVMFGDKAGTGVTFVSPTELTVKAPARSAGTVDVLVTSGGGTSPVNRPATLYTFGAPVVSGISPTSGPTTGGTVVTVTGTGFLSASAVSFAGTPATSFDVVSDTQLTTVAPGGAGGAVSVLVTGLVGTSANTSADDFTYQKVAQTITFAGPPAGSVGTSSTLTGGSSSGLAVSYSSATTGVCTTSGSSVTFVGAGTCTIHADQPGNGLYAAAARVTGSSTVSKGTQVITFPNFGTGKVGTSRTLGATSSSGLVVTLNSTTPSKCTVSGTTVTFVGAGAASCTVRASHAGNANWNAAPNVDQTVTVDKGDQVITFADISGGAPGDTESLSASASSGLTVSLASTTPGTCSVSGTTVNYSASGTCTVNATQNGDGNYNAATAVPRSATVTQPLTVSNVKLENSGNWLTAEGRIENNDTVTITFSEPVNPNTLCSFWSSSNSDKSVNNSITARLSNGGGSNDTMTFTASGGTCNFGTIDLGATGYVTTNNEEFRNSDAFWDQSARTLTITLGGRTSGTYGTVGSSNAVYTPSNAVKNLSGDSISGTFITGSKKQF